MRLGPVLEVLVIEDYYELWETLKVVAPIFEGSNDRHKFLIVNFVIMLKCIYRLRSVHDRVPQAVVAFLQKHSASGEVGCIDFDLSGSVKIVQCQYRCFHKGLLECGKCCFFAFSSVPGHVLLYKVIEQICFSREILNELAIEVGEAEESPNVLKVVGFQPVGDRGGFTMVHAYATRLNDHAEVFNAVIVKLAFLGLQI